MVKLCQVDVCLISSAYGILLSTFDNCIPKGVSFVLAIIEVCFGRAFLACLGCIVIAVNPWKSSRSRLIDLSGRGGGTSHPQKICYQYFRAGCSQERSTCENLSCSSQNKQRTHIYIYIHIYIDSRGNTCE